MKMTSKDYEVLTFVSRYVEKNRISPTLEEIGKSLYISKTTASRRIMRLISFGYITAQPKKPRSYVVVIEL